jgi:glutaminase
MGGDDPFVSTGELPPPTAVRTLLGEAHERFARETSGSPSTVYPALARVRPDLFGLCVAGTDGAVYAAGDADVEFAIMSVAKPFVFALVADAIGVERIGDEIGVDATGLPFDSLSAIERRSDGTTNPMVNAGAIATTGMVPGSAPDERWTFIVDGLSAFAGRRLTLDDETYASASATNLRNRAIAQLLESVGRVADPVAVLDLYTRQSCLRVTARDLAVMGATLADGGVNPISGAAVVSVGSCRCALVVMAIAGMYETSGRWLYDVGLPAKSGIGGGIVTVSPGKGGLGTFAPPLDDAGNSVRGQAVARFLSRRLGLDLFASTVNSTVGAG